MILGLESWNNSGPETRARLFSHLAESGLIRVQIAIGSECSIFRDFLRGGLGGGYCTNAPFAGEKTKHWPPFLLLLFSFLIQ